MTFGIAVLAACGDDGVSASSSAGSGTDSGSGGAGASTSSILSSGDGAGGASGPVVIDLEPVSSVDGEGSASASFELDGTREVHIDVGVDSRVLEIAIAHGAGIEVTFEGAPPGDVVDVGEPPADLESLAEGHWLRPRPVGGGVSSLRLVGFGDVSVQAFARGTPVPPVRRERSLVWTDGAILDDPTIVGLARVLAAASDDEHGGVMLDRWFRRFATTAHSERAAPATLMDDVAAEQGPDPTTWDLDALPFRVTGVHNRFDLADKNGDCGELRVSLGSTDPVASPMHVLFLFRQLPQADDLRFDDTRHCLGTARRWARLSALDGDAFIDAARDLVSATIVRGSFLLAETVELTVSPWEWRQWRSVGTDELDNPPLFQTVATTLVNAPGPLRDAFLEMVAASPEAFDAREALLPDAFAMASAQAPPSAPAARLDLTGLDPSVLAAYPDLARNIEIVGCPTCHTEHAEFVQTSIERTFSPFYDAELHARADRLDRLSAGVAVATPPFGPLQDAGAESP
jgi:hypothetical protein